MSRKNRRRTRFDWDRLEAKPLLSTLIALIDTGVDLSSTYNAPYYDFTNAYDAYSNTTAAAGGNGVVQDTNGHGSAVTDWMLNGLNAAVNFLPAGTTHPSVKIMPIRDVNPSNFIDSGALIRGVYWAVDHGAAVINLSVQTVDYDILDNTEVLDATGHYVPSDTNFEGRHNLYLTNLSQAILYAEQHGVVVVTAAGNQVAPNGVASGNIDGPDTNGVIHPYYPADAADSQDNHLGQSLNNLIDVAAVDSSGNLATSNWGPTHVDFGSPGSVTSFAAGYTSGVTGVISALLPNATAGQIVDVMKSTVTPMSQTVGAWSNTEGNLNPAGAVAQALSFVGAGVDYSSNFFTSVVTSSDYATPQHPGPTFSHDQNVVNVFDNNTSTKWLDTTNNGQWAEYQFATPHVITQYSITSGNDTGTYPWRAPDSWLFQASNDGTTWVTLDTRSGVADPQNLDARTFSFPNVKAYAYYRLSSINSQGYDYPNVSNGDSDLQFADLRLFGPPKSQFAVFRAASDNWLIRNLDGTTTTVQFGDPTKNDIPVPGDYDGTGEDQIAVYRPALGMYIIRHDDGSLTTIQMGDPSQGDIPVPGDYLGTGRTRAIAPQWVICDT